MHEYHIGIQFQLRSHLTPKYLLTQQFVFNIDVNHNDKLKLQVVDNYTISCSSGNFGRPQFYAMYCDGVTSCKLNERCIMGRVRPKINHTMLKFCGPINYILDWTTISWLILKVHSFVNFCILECSLW